MGRGWGAGAGSRGQATRRDIPDARSPALPPAPALIGARGRPPASSPAPPSQSGPPELGLSQGEGSDAVDWRLSLSPRRARRSPEPEPQAARPLAPSRRVPGPAHLNAAAPGPHRSASPPAGTRPDGAGRRRFPAASRRARPSPEPRVPAGPGERVGPAASSPAEAGCSRPSPTRCRPRRLWSRPTRTRWTSAPRCSSTECCGSAPSGGRRPSGPGGECPSRAEGGPPGEGARA